MSQSVPPSSSSPFEAGASQSQGQGQAQDRSDGKPQDTLDHPLTVFFHMLFRVGALAAYMLCTWFSSNFVLNFVVIILLLSLDFWTVKNISGRLLVGLRWWNEVSDDGESKWRFESKRNYTPNPRESRVFWWSLYIFMGLWVFMALIAFIRFEFGYLLIVIVALSLNTANVVGYTKCQKDATKHMQSVATSYLAQGLQHAVGLVGFGRG
eukprot:m.44367 g.44367  ORF g.44367 m.44367 type:complete len:209 (+) comp12320_c0_seq3:142-768(+)